MNRQLSLWKSARQKGTLAPDPSEFAMQCAVADRLAWDIKPGWFYSHIGHGERRERSAAIRLKRGGVRPGMPDFVIVGPVKPCGFYFLELKRRPNGLTPEQKVFCDIARSAGAKFAIAYELDEAIEILNEWNCLRRIVHDT